MFSAHGRFEPLPEPAVNSKLVRYNKQQFDRLIPALRGIALARSWAGLIDTTPDLVPIIGAVDSPARYFVAAGFNGHGLALGPVVGRVMSELIADGKSSIDVRALRPQRFAEGDVLRRQGAL
jgi:glycine/D-amino acid oxidase-like deaminating enzyme